MIKAGVDGVAGVQDSDTVSQIHHVPRLTNGAEIVVVNLNPCIDWQYSVPKFTFGGMNRVRHTWQNVAGKGINVCIALKNLGLDPMCTGFNFIENGSVITEQLDALGIRHDFVNVDGAVRVNIKLYEDSTGVMTELNQPGAFVPQWAQDELMAKLNMMEKPPLDLLVLSGSRPEGVPPGYYAQLCAQWPGKVFLDTDGEALQIALECATPPYAIKPNLFELESTFGLTDILKNSCDSNVTPLATQCIVDFCRSDLLSKGLHVVCVSMGADGAVLVTPERAYYCPALDIHVKGVQGAGDAMVAGLVYGAYMNAQETDFLPLAMSAAAASVIRSGTEMCSREDFEAMLWKVPNLTRLNGR